MNSYPLAYIHIAKDERERPRKKIYLGRVLLQAYVKFISVKNAHWILLAKNNKNIKTLILKNFINGFVIYL